MKKITQFTALMMLSAIISIYACSKSDPAPAATPAPTNNSTLTFDSKTDKVTMSCVPATLSYTLKATSSSGDTATCTITFQTKPVASGTYLTANLLDAGHCTLLFTKNSDNYPSSTGQTVNVSITTTGKVSASFTNLRTSGPSVKYITGSMTCD